MELYIGFFKISRLFFIRMSERVSVDGKYMGRSFSLDGNSLASQDLSPLTSFGEAVPWNVSDMSELDCDMTFSTDFRKCFQFLLSIKRNRNFHFLAAVIFVPALKTAIDWHSLPKAGIPCPRLVWQIYSWVAGPERVGAGLALDARMLMLTVHVGGSGKGDRGASWRRLALGWPKHYDLKGMPLQVQSRAAVVSGLAHEEVTVISLV